MKRNDTATDIDEIMHALESRGWTGLARTVIDVFDPFAPLLAPLCWVVQPFGNLFGARITLGRLGKVLDDPSALATLRTRLNTSSHPADRTTEESSQSPQPPMLAERDHL